MADAVRVRCAHSIIEMQVILVELLEHFEFAIPEDKPEIVRFPASQTKNFHGPCEGCSLGHLNHDNELDVVGEL